MTRNVCESARRWGAFVLSLIGSAWTHDVRKPALVVKDGVLYHPAELYSALGVES
jgi:hypothetical protein